MQYMYIALDSMISDVFKPFHKKTSKGTQEYIHWLNSHCLYQKEIYKSKLQLQNYDC